MGFVSGMSNALQQLFGDKSAPSIASQSIDYIIAIAQQQQLLISLPVTVKSLYGAWAQAISQVNSATPPQNVQPEITAELAFNAAFHALAVDLPVWVNALSAWYETYGVQGVGSTNIAAVPTIPSSLKQYLS